MSVLSKKIALITGGTSGIGRATAIAFAKEGAKVVVSGRRAEEGAETVRLVQAAGGEAIFVKADVALPEQVRHLVQKTVETFGRLDIAFNNAGIEGKLAPTHEQTVENYDQVFNINVKGLFLSMQAEILQFLKQGSPGAIINTSSVGGHVAFANVNIYVASKHAVEGLTKAAALEYAKAGIRVNAVAPAAIKTEMFDRFAPSSENQQYMAALHPIGRVGTTAEVASAVVYLASDAASFVTGISLPVDGGFLSQ